MNVLNATDMYTEGVKTVNFMLYIFYNTKKFVKDTLSSKKIYILIYNLPRVSCT